MAAHRPPGLVACWAAGLLLCALAAIIVGVMLVKGVSYLRPSLLVKAPLASPSQSGSGGFLDPIEGTLLLTAIGIAIAARRGRGGGGVAHRVPPPGRIGARGGVGRGNDRGRAERGAGVLRAARVRAPGAGVPLPDIGGRAVYGRSFFAAGAMMSLLALPLVVAATREGLSQIPAQMREASYALGKTRATTIRRVLLPSIRPSIASGATLGMGRIIGDTAIVVILLGSSLRLEGAGGERCSRRCAGRAGR